MKKYEILYIMRPNIGDEEIKKNVETINKIFYNNENKIIQSKELGLKDLAYCIDKHYKGYYVSMFLNAMPQMIEEFNRVVKINEDIIRSIVIKEE
ncbi:30S ribosomal protein S6 [Candidatus Phytoplasma mali]|uniref:Small ribosomal subunit protein bS6 n=1 Tax=Phytoplasma mali (strain AT) TaxID=482235 RepID=RS6_PHYMT|nr:30S ribosomal protein S6 [Candidatus Phytoplasma mali]B3R0K3.1 RecName: Full=Small ribosomal subunit protein bS6; AltName: Full=30S ribosomal protein S6 [Candidatus Phytoplasma mali AT]CAP18367.1 30S ribosomal protein S6 [Candidatus Phytoplasma mali]